MCVQDHLGTHFPPPSGPLTSPGEGIHGSVHFAQVSAISQIREGSLYIHRFAIASSSKQSSRQMACFGAANSVPLEPQIAFRGCCLSFYFPLLESNSHETLHQRGLLPPVNSCTIELDRALACKLF